MRSFTAGWIFFLALCPAQLGLAATAPADPVELLRESVEAPLAVSYVGQLQTVRFSFSHAVATIVRVEHRAPSFTRRWYLAPESLYGDYTITRGIQTYQFDTRREQITVSRNPVLDDALATEGNLDRVLSNYRALVEGKYVVAGRPAICIVLLNKYTGERAVRVWIDEGTHLLLRKEAYHANGAVAAEARFEDVSYTDKIPEDVFSTSTPYGFRRVRGRDAAAPSSDIAAVIRDAGFSPYTPRVLPQGFQLVSGDVSNVAGVKSLHLLYSDGLRSISLFENATGAAADFGVLRPRETVFEGHSAQYVEDGPTTLLTWNERDLHFALVGDELLPELVAIAKSVVP